MSEGTETGGSRRPKTTHTHHTLWYYLIYDYLIYAATTLTLHFFGYCKTNRHEQRYSSVHASMHANSICAYNICACAYWCIRKQPCQFHLHTQDIP